MKNSLGAGKKYPLRNPRFYKLANAAAAAERQGQFVDAAEFWSAAADQASGATNKVWSEHRELFCLSALRNGWSDRFAHQPG